MATHCFYPLIQEPPWYILFVLRSAGNGPLNHPGCHREQPVNSARFEVIDFSALSWPVASHAPVLSLKHFLLTSG